MEKDFEKFMSQLLESNLSLDFYSDFDKIRSNVEQMEISLNSLNYLLGKQDLKKAVELLWQRDKSVFDALDILIATRRKENRTFIDDNGQVHKVCSLFTSVEGVITFLEKTGLADVFRNEEIHNLVDYVFGVETGLDTNARKNRSGHITERLLAKRFESEGIKYRTEVSSCEFEQVQKVLGDDEKRFDFVVSSKEKTFLIEVNFSNSRGSKLNELARSFREVAEKINSVEDFEFVWVTDGRGWRSARTKLSEAYTDIRTKARNYYDKAYRKRHGRNSAQRQKGASGGLLRRALPAGGARDKIHGGERPLLRRGGAPVPGGIPQPSGFHLR